MSRVFITATGVASPLGSSFSEVMEGIEKGAKGLANIKSFDTSYFPISFAGEVKANGEVIKTDSSIDRKALFLEIALEQILSTSILDRYDPTERFASLGTGIDYFDLPNYINETVALGAPAPWGKYVKCSISAAKELTKRLELAGGCIINATACVASSQAIGLAFRKLKQDGRGVALTGGYDSMIAPLHYMGFYRLGALSTWTGAPQDACKPFDKNRCGMVLGEGAALYCLEPEATARQEEILAEVVGYSSTMDAYLVTDPDPEGKYLAKAALEAIHGAGLSPEDIDCVHLHGTGTYKNAISESNAMKIVFGKRGPEIPVFSLKGQTGHLVGACGALELMGVIYSLRNQCVPPTVNFKTPDPKVPLNVIKDKPLCMNIRNILKLNSAFGGQNTALVVRRYE
ncbi:MAG TPA: beta-ketoacyl-[acyl-carrier-protein] synthase family protein [Desulfobacterales bacterium]|nr:beta-ketoacyl-[acyl-carrier-protein] synthase family protein [Desulfobacterales bacterium]